MAEELHRFIIDRFEDDLVVVEVDGARMLDLPRWLLPESVRPDDVVIVERASSGGGVTLTLRADPAATEAARAQARRLVDELRKRDPGGDIVL